MADQDTTIRLSFPVLYQELGMRTILATDGTCVLKAGYIAPVADPVPDGPRFTAVLFTVPGVPGRGEVGGGTAESLDKLGELLRQRLAERGPWWKAASPEPERFPSLPLPAPCEDCGGQLCAECARHNLTTHHFRPDGICPNGHRLDLTAWLIEWIKAEGITGNYPPDGIASRVVAQVHRSYLTAWLGQGGTDYLRHLVRRIKDTEDLTDSQLAAEMRRHGHGTR